MKLDLSLRYEPKRIISIVCSSRSGSTAMKAALAQHPDLTSLAGEEEPYYKLAHNGWPWHDSDEFHEVNNPELIRALIANEVHGNELDYNRKWLQDNKVEEPPYITCTDRAHYHVTDTLLLKTPQNCYRRGVLEQLYPDAEVQYVAIHRELPALINGLIDGWEAPGMFEARKVGEWGWWKFDMPSGWHPYMPRSIEEIAVFQAEQAREAIRKDYNDALVFHYSDFVRSPIKFTRWMWGELGIGAHVVERVEHVPPVGVTDSGGPERWKEKRPWLAKYA